MHPMRVKRFFQAISLDELGVRTGIDQARLSRIERGYASPTQKEKEVISDVLQCPVDELFTIESKELDAYGRD